MESLFLQPSEREAELEQLYKDLEALARKDAGDDDGMDIEVNTRIDSVMEKIRVVYLFIDTKQDM